MASNIDYRYANCSSLTITLASLASDTTLLQGRESTAVDNGTNIYPDVHVCGRITVSGTVAPTAGNQIEVWAYGSIDDSPNSVVYPGGVTGSDAAITFTNAGKKRAALRLVAKMTVTAVTGIAYDFAEVSIARLFNGMPRHWGIVVINGTGQALHVTASNHFIIMKPQGFYIP